MITPSELLERLLENDAAAVAGALAENPALAAERDPYLGSTPLHFAAHRGFSEIVDALLAAGADVHARERASNTTPLHWAAEAGHPAIIRALLARDAEKEALDVWYKLSPLGWAVTVDWARDFREDKAAATAVLREAGATLDPFSAIVLGEHEALREDPTIQLRRLGPVGRAMLPLHFAVERGRLDATVLLLDLGARHDEVTSFGLTPLALAHAEGHLAIAEVLRARGADEDLSCAVVTGDLDETRRLAPVSPLALRGLLLLSAARRGDAEVVAALLEQDADPDTGVSSLIGETPCTLTALHVAAKGGHVAVAQALLAEGAQASPGAAEGKPTPLHLAAQRGHLPFIRLLLAAGADRAAREDGFGATPSGWAADAGHPEVAALLAVDESPSGAE